MTVKPWMRPSSDVVTIATPVFAYFLASDVSFSHPLAGAPSSPGSYAFRATFAGTANYLPASMTASFKISIPVSAFKATAILASKKVKFSGVVVN